jgi:hypothetical protein
MENPEPEGRRSVMVSLRMQPSQLAEIDRRAAKAGLSRTEYMVRAALGGDPVDKRLAAMERRLRAVEGRRS